MKKSVIASNAVENDDDLVLDKKTWDQVRELGMENLHKYIKTTQEDSEEDDLERKHKYLTDGGTKMMSESEDSDDEVDDKVKQINRMAEELDASIRQEKEYKMIKSKKEIKKDMKNKAMIEL